MVRKIWKDITGSWKPYDFDQKCTQHGQTRSMGQHLEGAAVNTAGGYVDCPQAIRWCQLQELGGNRKISRTHNSYLVC